MDLRAIATVLRSIGSDRHEICYVTVWIDATAVARNCEVQYLSLSGGCKPRHFKDSWQLFGGHASTFQNANENDERAYRVLERSIALCVTEQAKKCSAILCFGAAAGTEGALRNAASCISVAGYQSLEHIWVTGAFFLCNASLTQLIADTCFMRR